MSKMMKYNMVTNLDSGLCYLNSVVIFSIGFPFPFKNNKVALYFYSTKLKVGSKYLSHLVCL
jgi:hypothetical protein